MRSEICIKGMLIISLKFVTIWVVKRGEGLKQTVTKCDKGGGGSSSQRVMSPLQKNIVSTIALE